MNSSLGACRTLKDLDLRLIVGYSSKSMISYRVPNGYEGKEHGAKVNKDLEISRDEWFSA